MRPRGDYQSPTRYQLHPHEARKIRALAEKNGGLTPEEMRGIARSKGSALKPIQRILECANLPILPSREAPPKKSKKPTASYSNPDSFFKTPAAKDAQPEAVEPAPPITNEKDYADAQAEMDLLREALRAAEAKVVKVENDAMTMIAEAEKARSVAEGETERARTELRRVAKLRKQTRDERDESGDLREALTAKQAECEELLRRIARQKAMILSLKDERDIPHAQVAFWTMPEIRKTLKALEKETARRAAGGRAKQRLD